MCVNNDRHFISGWTISLNSPALLHLSSKHTSLCQFFLHVFETVCRHVLLSVRVWVSMVRTEGWYLLSLRLSVLVQWAWHWPTFTAITLALSSCPSHRHCIILRLFSALKRSTFTQIPNCLRIKWVHKICLICMWIHMCMPVYVPVGELGSLFCIEKKNVTASKKSHLPFHNIMCLLLTIAANYILFVTFWQTQCSLWTDLGHSSL